LLHKYQIIKMITATIVDDEADCCEALVMLLERYCPEVKVLDICYSAETAIQSIKEHEPQILFLDIEMPFMNGFEMLERLGTINFELVFTTSYDQYAIRAIRFSALDYLLKPVDRDELQKAVQKAAQRNKPPVPLQLDLLLQKLRNPTIPVNKIAIPTMEGFQLLAVECIINCESQGNYTHLLLKDRRKIIASRNLKEIEDLLEGYPFIRVHHSHVVNINQVEKYIKGEGGYLIMSDGSSINVSRSRKELLLKKLSLK
jgi:two-component system LytT family response regulator